MEVIGVAKRPRHKHEIKIGRMCKWPANGPNPDEVASKASKVTYTGSPQHKTYPSPAGAPALKADKAKCDKFRQSDWPKLLEVLRSGIKAKCVGEFRGEFPSRVWVWINNVLHEARLTAGGDYHGFPIDDPRQYPEPNSELEIAPRVSIDVVD